MAKARIYPDKPSGEPVTDFLPILVRAYVPRQGRRGGSPRAAHQSLDPSDYVLVLDTETTTDAGQSLRFGFYHERDGRDRVVALRHAVSPGVRGNGLIYALGHLREDVGVNEGLVQRFNSRQVSSRLWR